MISCRHFQHPESIQGLWWEKLPVTSKVFFVTDSTHWPLIKLRPTSREASRSSRPSGIVNLFYRRGGGYGNGKQSLGCGEYCTAEIHKFQGKHDLLRISIDMYDFLLVSKPSAPATLGISSAGCLPVLHMPTSSRDLGCPPLKLGILIQNTVRGMESSVTGQRS